MQLQYFFHCSFDQKFLNHLPKQNVFEDTYPWKERKKLIDSAKIFQSLKKIESPQVIDYSLRWHKIYCFWLITSRLYITQIFFFFHVKYKYTYVQFLNYKKISVHVYIYLYEYIISYITVVSL